MKQKYFNEAIIGNSDGSVIASFTGKGELLRLFHPNTDFRQFFEFFQTGVQLNDSNIIYLHNDINNKYKQYYTKGTNILNTEIFNTYFKFKITQKDFVPVDRNVLVKRYEFKNENSIDLNLKFLAYSKLITEVNNDVSGFCKNNVLKQYMHDFTVSIFSKKEIDSVQINNTVATIEDGNIGGKDYVGMSPDSSISYDMGVLTPGETVIIDLFIYIKENSMKNSTEKFEQDIEKILKLDVKKELDDTKKFWNKYLKQHITIDSEKINSSKIMKIYERTILLYPLLVNHKTGGISAGIEIDEEKTKCGRYSFCWPRDAIFITNAMDILNMTDISDKFYNVFCKNTQSKNGMWEQRFYTDGTLAPSWGYQIDETASVICGVYDHYMNTKNVDFLKTNLKMCEKATEFLFKYIDEQLHIENKSDDTVKNEILNSKNNNKSKDDSLNFCSYDLGEESEGIHTYSIAAIYSAINKMDKIYEELLPHYETNRLKQEKMIKKGVLLEKNLDRVKEYITNNLYNEEQKYFKRNLKDNKLDISLLGLVTPFEVYDVSDKKIQNTVDKINLTLRTYTGGYLRYEDDNYSNGNPWVIATLWMAEYHLMNDNILEAKKCFEFVVNSCSEHGFLGEQVNNDTMSPAWVIGLGWSHAMFINILKKLYK